MSGTNQYLPFGYGSGANVEAPATYAADARRTNGNVNGVADPAFCNTAWRQASVAVAALAQFCVDQTGMNLNDDGSPANFEAAIVSALGTFVAGALAAGANPIRSAFTALTISGGIVNIDCNAGNYARVNMTANITNLTFSNIPGAGIVQEITVDFVADGTDHGHSFLLGSLLNWLGIGAAGTAPTFLFTTSGARNTVVFKLGEGITTAVAASYSGTSAK